MKEQKLELLNQLTVAITYSNFFQKSQVSSNDMKLGVLTVCSRFKK